MNNILIDFVGDVNVGKTTVSSIFTGTQLGEVKRKHNTEKSSIYCLSNNNVNSNNSDNSDNSDNDIMNVYNWFDETGSQFSITVRDTVAINESNFKVSSDLLVVIIDVTVGITDALQQYLDKNTNELKIFILNKYDEDDTELVEYANEIQKQLNIDKIIVLNSLPIYECMFNSNSNKALAYSTLCNGNVNNMYDRNGLFRLRKSIHNLINENMNKIYDTRIQNLNNNKANNIRNLVETYNECSKNTSLEYSLVHYVNIFFDLNDYENKEGDENEEEEGDEDNEDIDNEDDEECDDEECDDEDDEECDDEDDDCNCNVDNDEDLTLFEGTKDILQYLDNDTIKKIVNKYYDTSSSFGIMNKFVHYFGCDNKVCIMELFKLIMNHISETHALKNITDVFNKYETEFNLIKNVDMNEEEIVHTYISLINTLRKYLIFVFNKLELCKNPSKMDSDSLEELDTYAKNFIVLKILENKYYSYSYTKLLQFTNKYAIKHINNIITCGYTCEQNVCSDLLSYLRQKNKNMEHEK